jgi:hypothetical protein
MDCRILRRSSRSKYVTNIWFLYLMLLSRVPRHGRGRSRRRPAGPGGRTLRPIRWAAGAEYRMRRAGGRAAPLPRGAPGTAGRSISATCPATCRAMGPDRMTASCWRRSRLRPGLRSGRRPRARRVGPPGRAGGGSGGSTMSPSLVAGRSRQRRPGAGQEAPLPAVKGAGLAISLRQPGGLLSPADSASGRAGRGQAPGTACSGPLSVPAASGRRTWNAAPCPGWVSTAMSPSCAATSAAAIDRPSPVPPRARPRALSVR